LGLGGIRKWTSRRRSAVAVTVSGNAAQPPQNAGRERCGLDPQLDLYKRNVGMEVDAMGENIQKMNDMVFSFAEPGFQEFETSSTSPRSSSRTASPSSKGMPGFRRRGPRHGDRASR
jgi:hypothetical protein